MQPCKQVNQKVIYTIESIEDEDDNYDFEYEEDFEYYDESNNSQYGD